MDVDLYYQYFAYLGISFWIILFLALLNWKLLGRYRLERMNKKLVENIEEEIISSRRTFAQKSITLFTYILYGFRLIIIFLSFVIFDETIFGSVMSKNFIAANLTMLCLIIPSYFGVLLIISTFNDIAKSLDSKK